MEARYRMLVLRLLEKISLNPKMAEKLLISDDSSYGEERKKRENSSKKSE